MPATEPAVPETATLFPEGTVDAGVYPSAEDGFSHSLVLLAMGEPCWLVPAPDGHHLRVEPAALEPARRQLELYDRENHGWPPPPSAAGHTAHPVKNLPLSPLLWLLGVFAAFRAQQESPAFTDAWLLDAERVFSHGEWWRAATALWLHGDLGHLVSNAVSGLLVFSALLATFRALRGWCLLAGAAILGNLAAAAVHFGESYRSLGASTAIFAALGLLTGHAVRSVAAAGPRPFRLRALGVPLASGLVVLGLYGAGGVEVDILAHATGFAAGLLLGLLAGLNPVDSDGGADTRPASASIP